MCKSIMCALAVVLALGFANQTQAADGNLSGTELSALGLSDMNVMSDAQGEEVRGKGYASAWGSGYASVFGSASSNGYFSAGNYVAAGVNVSGAVNNFGFWAVGGGFSASFAY